MALPVIPNVAKGRLAEYAILARDQPTGFASARLRWILLKSSGLEAYTALQDYADMTTLLAAANDEATFTGYARITVTAGDISVAVNNTPDTQTVDITTDPSWNPTSAEAIGAIVLAFNPDGSDTTLIPIFIDAASGTTGTGGSGTPFTYQVASGGFVTSS